MSVMILSSSQIIAIASFATHEKINFDGEYLSTTKSLATTKSSMQRLADSLLAMNIECFEARYKEDGQCTIEVTDAHAAMSRPDPVPIARTLALLTYNSDEADGWHDSTQKKAIFEIQRRLLLLMVGDDTVDQYPQFEHDAVADGVAAPVNLSSLC